MALLYCRLIGGPSRRWEKVVEAQEIYELRIRLVNF